MQEVEGVAKYLTPLQDIARQVMHTIENEKAGFPSALRFGL